MQDKRDEKKDDEIEDLTAEDKNQEENAEDSSPSYIHHDESEGDGGGVEVGLVMPTEEKKSKDQKRREFILNGNVLHVVLYIAMPLMMLNAFNYLYGIIDTIVLAGKGGNVLSSVVMVDQIKNLFMAVASALSLGGSIIVSRLIGKNNFYKAKRVANTIVTFAVIVAVLVVVIMVPLARSVLVFVNFSEELIDIGLSYFIVQLFSVSVSIFNNVFFGLEKARGATTNVLAINVCSMGFKIVLTLFFVYVLDTDIVMVAASTLIANMMITTCALYKYTRKDYIFRYNFKDIMFKKEVGKPMFGLAFPQFLGNFSFSLGKVIVNYLSLGFGELAPGALGVSNSMSSSVMNVTNSMQEASSVVISQNISVGNIERVKKTFFASLFVNITVAFIGISLLVIFNDLIVSYFANGDEEMATMISEIFFWERMAILPLTINSAIMGLVFGLGYTKLSMYLNLARLFVFRIPSILIMMAFFAGLGVQTLGLAMFISNAGVGITSSIVAIHLFRKMKRVKLTDSIDI